MVDAKLIRAICMRPAVRIALADGNWAPLLDALKDAGVSQTEVAASAGLSQSQVSRIASGKTGTPSLATIKGLCDGLGIPRSLAGLTDQGPTENDTDRRTFLGTTLATVAGATFPAELESGDERLLRTTTATYRQLEQRTPAWFLIDPVTSHLALGRRLASRSSGTSKTRVLAAVSETAGLAAWLYADLVEPVKARQAYRVAMGTAAKSGHRLLQIYMQGSAGQYATASGDPVEGLRLLHGAAAQLPRHTPPVARAWLASLQAVALSHLGDRLALRSLSEAERHAETDSDEEPAWPWLFRFDIDKIAASRATVSARLGEPTFPRSQWKRATASSRSPKQAALLATERARALVTAGQLDEAVSTAEFALDMGHAHGSERVRQAVREVRAQIPSSRLTIDLDERLHASYNSDDG